MPRRSPEKLAAALRANLKRRRVVKASNKPPEAANIPPVADPANQEKAPSCPVEKAQTPPSAKG